NHSTTSTLPGLRTGNETLRKDGHNIGYLQSRLGNATVWRRPQPAAAAAQEQEPKAERARPSPARSRVIFPVVVGHNRVGDATVLGSVAARRRGDRVEDLEDLGFAERLALEERLGQRVEPGALARQDGARLRVARVDEPGDGTLGPPCRQLADAPARRDLQPDRLVAPQAVERQQTEVVAHPPLGGHTAGERGGLP